MTTLLAEFRKAIESNELAQLRALLERDASLASSEEFHPLFDAEVRLFPVPFPSELRSVLVDREEASLLQILSHHDGGFGPHDVVVLPIDDDRLFLL